MSIRRVVQFALEIVGTVVLLVVYFVVITVAGGAMRLLGRSPLRHRSAAGGFWQRHRGAADRRAMERQS